MFTKTQQHIDYITFSGSGEPTLHAGLGCLIRAIKHMTHHPVAVLTNGSLLFMPGVQQDLLNADIVAPTLCTANQRVFRRIHHGPSSLKIDRIIKGMVDFRRIYKGKIWLEVMLLKGINDSANEVRELRKAIKKIKPDKIHLNTVIRPPNEKSASPLSLQELRRIKKTLGRTSTVIADFNPRKHTTHTGNTEKTILELIKRRPVTIADLGNLTGMSKTKLSKCLAHMEKRKLITRHEFNGRKYYEKM
jgi:wyosine [tRNA(Phe)-imidazoG37] synthetase (radical SAM superfamily)